MRGRVVLVALCAAVAASAVLWLLLGEDGDADAPVTSALPETAALPGEADAAVLAAPAADATEEEGTSRTALPKEDPAEAASTDGEGRSAGPLPDLLVGTVVDSGTAAPVPGARVRVLGRPEELLTDADGQFRLTDPGDVTWIDVTAEGFAVAGMGVDPASLDRTSDGKALSWVMLLPRGAEILGRVQTAGGVGVEGVEVRLIRSGPPDARLAGTRAEGPWSRVSDAAGEVTFSGLPGVSLEVELHLPGGAVRRVEAIRPRNGRSREVFWRVGATRLSGTVVDGEGLPVAGANLALVRTTSRRPRYMERIDSRNLVGVAVTDEYGRYAMAGLPAGLYVLGPHRPAGTPTRFAPHMTPVEFTATATEVVVDLVLHRGLFVGGTLVYPDGRPAEDFNVAAWPKKGRGAPSDDTDEEGRFRIGPLVPGIVGLEVDGQGGFGIWKTVEVEAGQEDVLLTLAPSGHLRGLAVQPTGAPLDSAEVAFVPAPGENRNGFITFDFTDRDGSFGMSNMAPAVYDIVVQRENDELVGFAAGIAVDTGGTRDDIRVKTERGGWVRVLYTGARTAVRARYFSGDVQIDVDDLTSGRAHRQLVPAGPVLVRVEEKASGYREEVTVEVAPGETVEVTFPAEPR